MGLLSEEAIDDLLYCARYGELEDLKRAITALSDALSLPQSQIVEAIVEQDTGNTPLHMACANGHRETTEYLLPFYTSFPQNSSGSTPLHWAAFNGHLDIVKLLVSAGADVSALNKAGRDAIYEAEVGGKNEVVGWLLSEGGMELDKSIGGESGEAHEEEEEEEAESELPPDNQQERKANVSQG